MLLFPAIDILNGRAVRLLRGDYAAVTDYGKPVERALKWESEGAEYLHIVDLDGAKNGSGVNLNTVREITAAVKIPVQLGGGIRTLADIKSRLAAGAARVILGTVCCREPELVKQAVQKFGAERIVAGIDAKDGRVAVAGWVEETEISPIALGKLMRESRVRYTVYTDIGRDGALTGVNTAACREMSEQTGLRCIASGGVSTLDDLRALSRENLYGAILGRAIYENRFTVAEAINTVKNIEK
jgi:phosphoribosylformimino-5-aminoimidazole carboxamide ribotide isomerase